jgi:histone-lysine N-methyltransferase MLL3
MCVSCGSIGIDEEGRLISCSQCGQSYHPYCVGFTKMVCLSSTDKNKRKEFRNFSSSYQTFFLIKVGVVLIVQSVNVVEKVLMKGNFYYVMIVIYPIILIVFNHHLIKYPKEIGNVNGKEYSFVSIKNLFIRCVRCLKCGSTSPGIDCQWENNYTECGQCYSLNTCPLCLRKYRLDELIIQCTNCNRWCHSMCANIFTEEMAEKKCDEQTFLCLLCKPDQSTLTLMRYLSMNSVNDQQILQTKSVKYDEGVYLTENGLAHLKSIRPKTLTHPTRKSKQSIQKINHEDERSDEEKIKKPPIKKYTGKIKISIKKNSIFFSL